MINGSDGMKMEYSAILLLGGKSTRFNGSINKVYSIIKDKPLFMYSLEKFINDEDCIKIVVVYNEEDKELLFRYDISSSKIMYVLGGNERYKSVLNGLEFVQSEYVLVHDGARPLITKLMIEDVLKELCNSDCVSVGLPVTDTLKKVNIDGCVSTVDRSCLYSVQTPQGTKTNILRQALSSVNEENLITDDLMAIEKHTNVNPKIILGSKKNVKVTTQEDLKLVEFYLGLGE